MLAGLPALSIEGPKAVGKTATASRRATSLIALDDDDEMALLDADRGRLDRLPPPVLVDEWQRYPRVWDLVRRSVDRNPSAGRFVLTGSASPVDAPTHSGAGRIVRLRMRPMSLCERQVTTPTVSLAALLTGRRPEIAGESRLDLAAYTDEVVRSGFPAIRTLDEPHRRDALDGYLAEIVRRDFPEQGHVVRRPATLRAWLQAYAAATASTASYNVILQAATAGDGEQPAKTTTIAYRDVLAQLWLLEPVPGWLPTRNHFTRLSQAPKHHLADPALAARLLGVGASALLDQPSAGPPVRRDGPLLGALFESLVTLSVRVYAQRSRADVHHLRTARGDREVDLIVARDDGRVVAFEVKLSPSVDDKDITHLRWLREQLQDDLLDAGVITTGKAAYRRPDGIAVIPAALLGP
ncbi:ATP-binding protein [Jiangella aurantiaca]|uniref:ATP-binding protein n=2 Tax=Jiangella aurantiaca TaxID=2530373 RepID=A0A4R5AM20_9ACTN|nr:ATP-binding protein [Jiangella aurantiaca]